MQFSQSLIILSVMLIGSMAWAQSTTTSYSGLRQQMADNSWTLGFGYGRTSTKFNHREAAGNQGFSNLSGDTEVAGNQLQLIFAKEFMGARLFSLSLLAEGGVIDGKEQDGVQKSANQRVNFTEKVAGTTFAAGLSANLNTYAWGYRLQPFIASKFVQENITANLSYGIDRTYYGVETDFAMTGIEYTAGIRIYDAAVNMMSYLAIDYLSALTTSAVNRGRVNDNAAFALAENTPVRDPISLSAGFGFFF